MKFERKSVEQPSGMVSIRICKFKREKMPALMLHIYLPVSCVVNVQEGLKKTTKNL